MLGFHTQEGCSRSQLTARHSASRCVGQIRVLCMKPPLLLMQVEELQSQLQQKLLGSQLASPTADPTPSPYADSSFSDTGGWGAESDAAGSPWAGVGPRIRALAAPSRLRGSGGNGLRGSFIAGNGGRRRLKGATSNMSGMVILRL